MVYLDAKYGALQKGLVQDHERPGALRVRVKVVRQFLELLPRMFAYRAVVVAEAKKYMPKPEAKSTSPQKGNEKALMAGLKLDNAKDEPPDEKEMVALLKLAQQHCDESARGIIEGATSEKLLWRRTSPATSGLQPKSSGHSKPKPASRVGA